MKRYLLLTFILTQRAFAQEITSEEDRKMFVQLMYEQERETFTPGSAKFKTERYEPADYFTCMSEEETASCLQLMKKTAKLALSEDRLYFSANILTILNDPQRIGSVDVTKHENRLFNDKEALEITNSEGGGNSAGNDYYQVTLNYPLRENLADRSKIHGSLVIKVDFLTGYDSVLLTSQDKGKKITLGDETLKIVNIIDNVIVLKGSTKKVKLINFAGDQMVAVPLDREGAFLSTSYTTYKSCYENIVVKKMSLKDFDKVMTLDKLNAIEQEEAYRVIRTLAPIKGKFILYQPVYSTHFLTVNY